MTIWYCEYLLSHCACRASVCCASARIAEESVSKKMRSPTLTVKSCADPGVAAPAPRPRSAALLGVFFEAQPASPSDATSATITGFDASFAIRRMPPLLRISSGFIDPSVTTFGLTATQETELKIGCDRLPPPVPQRFGDHIWRRHWAEMRPKRGHAMEKTLWPRDGSAVMPIREAATTPGPKRNWAWGSAVRYVRSGRSKKASGRPSPERRGRTSARDHLAPRLVPPAGSPWKECARPNRPCASRQSGTGRLPAW